MVTPDPESHHRPHRSWASLAARARCARPHEIDVRAAVRASIAQEAGRVRHRAAEPRFTVFAELAGLCKARATPVALTVCGVFALILVSFGGRALLQVGELLDLAGPLLFTA